MYVMGLLFSCPWVCCVSLLEPSFSDPPVPPGPCYSFSYCRFVPWNKNKMSVLTHFNEIISVFSFRPKADFHYTTILFTLLCFGQCILWPIDLTTFWTMYTLTYWLDCVLGNVYFDLLTWLRFGQCILWPIHLATFWTMYTLTYPLGYFLDEAKSNIQHWDQDSNPGMKCS